MQVAFGAGVGVASGLALFYITNRHRERKERDLLAAGLATTPTGGTVSTHIGGVPNPRAMTRRTSAAMNKENAGSPPSSPLRFEKGKHAAVVSGTRKRRPAPSPDLELRGDAWTKLMEVARGGGDATYCEAMPGGDSGGDSADDIGEDVDSDYGFEKISVVDRILERHPCSTTDHDQLHRDAHRTFPENPFFQNTDNQHLLKLVLQALAVQFPDVGYVQGMNFIAAHLLYHTRSADQAHALCTFIWTHEKFNAQRLFAKGLVALKCLTSVLDSLVEKHLPVLARHMRAQDLGAILYAQRWFLTFFSYSLPYEPLAQLWDAFLVEGYVVLFKLALFLLQSSQNKLLRCDFGEMLMILTDVVAEAGDGIVPLSQKTIILSAEDRSMIAHAMSERSEQPIAVATSPAVSPRKQQQSSSLSSSSDINRAHWESDLSDEDTVLVSHTFKML